MKQTQVKKRNNNTAYGAWGLLLCLLPLFFVKATHFHLNAAHAYANEHKQELTLEAANATTETCLICQFELVPCVEAVITIQAETLIHFCSLIATYSARHDIPASLGVPTLRAPPYWV